RAERIPEDLGVVVAVVVHEPGRYDPAVGLDGSPRWPVETPQLGDLAPHHADVAVEGGPTGAIDDATVLDQQVVGHVILHSGFVSERGDCTPVSGALSSALLGCGDERSQLAPDSL